MTNEINKLNKVKEIKSELEKMYQSVKQEACTALGQIQEKFRSHETEFKEKIFKYVSQIRKNLETLQEEPDAKITELLKKIDGLIGETPLRGHKGKLRELQINLRKFTTKIKKMRDTAYVRTGVRLRADVINQLIVPIRRFRAGIDEHSANIMNTIQRLGLVQQTFQKEKHRLTTMINDLKPLIADNISGYYDKITNHESHLFHFDFLNNQIQSYETSLIETKKDLKKVMDLNRDIGPHMSSVNHDLRELIEKMEDVEDVELDRVLEGAREVEEFIDLIKKQIENTRHLFEYLENFSNEKAQIDELKLTDEDINLAGTIIEELGKVKRTTLEKSRKIHEHKETLTKKFIETISAGTVQPFIAKSPEKREFFPDEFRIMDELDRLDGHLEKIRAIKDFNTVLEGTDPNPFLDIFNVDIKGKNNIGELFSALNKMEICLSSTEQGVQAAIEIIKSSNEPNKSKLSDTQNGNNIQGLVGEIKQIPGKLSELHKSVRIYIQLTQIVSKTIETLDKMKSKAESLNKTKETVEKFKEKIPLIEKELNLACWNMIYLSFIGRKAGLYNVRRTVKKSKEYIEKIDISMKSIRTIEKNRDIGMTKLQECRKTLGEIYLEIERKMLQLIEFIPGICSGITYIRACADVDIKTEYLLACEIIGYLRGIVRKTSQLITTICRLQHSICCTKRKLGCFVSSLETRIRWIGEGVREVESSIESVIICFLKCSNKSITNNTIKTTKRMLASRGHVSNNELGKRFLRCL